MAKSPDAITRLSRACEPNEAIAPTDPRHVDLDPARGTESVVEILARGIRRADPGVPEVRMFAGHRGVGKSSELLRLKVLLEHPTESNAAYFVVLFDTSDSVDTNDLDLPDLLVVLASQLQEQLAKAGIPGFSAMSTYLKRVWDDIAGTFGSRVKLEGGELGTDWGNLALELRNRPTQRAMLREAIERHSSSLLGAINDLLDAAQAGLRSSGREGLVLMVDGLDKLVRRPLDDHGSNTHERLFFDRSEQLASLHAHAIYTVPISLIYSPRCGQLEQTLGVHAQPVSMLSLRGRSRGEAGPNTTGMTLMREMLEKRCRHADTSLDEAFESEETLEYVIRMTGGHPRHLLMFVQAAANRCDALPLTLAAAEQAVAAYANSLLREVRDEARPKLQQFSEPQDTIPKDEIHQEMLFLLHVFEYMNGTPWYEVNPVLRDVLVR